jgi:hypothetical protein
MTLFLLLIWCVGCEFIDAVNYIHRLSLSIHRWFQGLQWLCFRHRFVDQPRHSVFNNSMLQLWLYFWSVFDASVVNSVTLSIPYVNFLSVLIDDFKVYSYSVFAGDLWISRDVAFLTIQSVSHDSIFSIDLMGRLWIHWRCRFHMSAVT